MRLSQKLGTVFVVAALLGSARPGSALLGSDTPPPSPRLCTWTVKGNINVDHQLGELNDTYGDVSPLEGVKVKVSAKLRTLVGWGWYDKWEEVYTDKDGFFEVKKEKTCDGRRRFKVQIKFQKKNLEVRHESATYSPTKVLWYVVHEDGDAVDDRSHTRSLGDLTFRRNGPHDLGDDEARDHADIWTTYTAVLDKLARYGPAYEVDGSTIVKYPSNNLFGDSVETSYTNPGTKIIYIFRSNDGQRDELSTTTLLHEFMHRWMFEKAKGELDLVLNWAATQDTHCFEPAHVSFHEGSAAFGAEQLNKILFGQDSPGRPFNRDALKNGLTCNNRVDQIANLGQMETHELGWLSAFRLLAEKQLLGSTFAGTPTSTNPADVSAQITQSGAQRIAGCQNPVGFNFKKIMSVFLPGQLPVNTAAVDGTSFLVGAGGLGKGNDGIPLGEHDDDLRKDDMTFDAFFDRAAAILEIGEQEKEHLLTLLDPEASQQPTSLFCGGLIEEMNDINRVNRPRRLPGGVRNR